MQKDLAEAEAKITLKAFILFANNNLKIQFV